jgi:hypothetical protein
MIPNHTQKTKARSGMAQKNDFFATIRRSSSAGMRTSDFQLFCNQSRPQPGIKNDNF